MILDRLEMSYCEGLDYRTGRTVGPLSPARAAERHQAGEQYAVLLAVSGRPLALVEMALGELHCGVRFFDEQLRPLSEVGCRLLDAGRLFRRVQRRDPVHDPERVRQHERSWAREIDAWPDGTVQYSTILADGSLRNQRVFRTPNVTG